MKTIIGSLLTVLLIIGMTLGISVSIVPMQVQAETEVTIEETSDGIYFDNYAVLGREIFNETYSGETEPIGWKKGPLSALDQYYSRKVEGDAMVIRHLDTETSSSSLDTFASKDIMDFVLDNDTEKMTRLLSNQVSGKFAVEMEFEADLNTDRANPTYIQFEFGYRESPDLGAADMSSPLAQIRLFTNGNLRYQHSSTIVSTTTFVKEQRHTLRLEIDTETAKINVFLDDDHFAVNEDIIANHVKLFNAIKIRTMRATAMGSYFKLYGIRVYQLDDSASEVFTGAFDTYGALPDIASDPSNVVSDLQIPDVAEYGVTSVTSSDTSIIAASGKITRDIDDQSASIYMQYFKTYSNSTPKAEYQIVFRKAYDFTVKAIDSAESTIISDESKTGSFDEKEWKFTGEKGEYVFGQDGLVIKKIGAAEDVVINNPSITGTRVYKVPVIGTGTQYEELFDITHMGIYDFEMMVIPNITGRHPAFLEIGYKNLVTGTFVSYGILRFLGNTVDYSTGDAFEEISNELYGNSFYIKIRIDTDTKQFKIWNDSKLLTPNGIPYVSQATVPINAIRVSVDENSGTGDTFILESVKMTRRMVEENQTMDRLRAAGETISITDITDEPDDVRDSLKPLPSTANDIPIVWSVDNPIAINPESGAVYRQSTTQNVILSATLMEDDFAVTKEFYLTIKPASDQQEMLDSAVHLLTWDSISKQPQDDIRYDINLTKEGAFGAAIEWTSSAPEFIDSTGKINKSVIISQNTSVVLTAEVELGGVSSIKSFDVQLKKRGWENKIISATPILINPYIFEAESQTGLVIKNDVIVSVTARKTGYPNGEIDIVDLSGNKIASVLVSGDELLIDGTVIANISNNTDFDIAVTVLQDVKRISVSVDGVLKADYLPIKVSFDGVSGVSCLSSDISVNKIEVFMEDYGILDLNASVFDYMDNLPNSVTDTDLMLQTQSFLGVSALWTSSNTSVIANDGKITRGKGYGFADLTLTLSNDRVNVQYTRDFAVVPAEEEKIVPEVEVKTTMLQNPTHPVTYAFDGKLDTYFDGTVRTGQENSITLTLDGSSYVNQIFIHEYLEGIDAYKVEYSYDGEIWNEVVSCDITDIRSKLAIFTPIKPKHIKIEFVETSANKLSIIEVTPLLDIDMEQVARIDLDEILIDTTVKVDNSLTLVEKGKYGSGIIWLSSNPSVISNSGIYTAPDYDEWVTLTAYVEVNGRNIEKSYNVIAKGKKGPKGANSIPGPSGRSGTSRGGIGFPAAIPGAPDIPDVIGDNSNSIFYDVTEGHWAYNDIKRLKDAEIISGDGTGNYYPNQLIKREEFLKMLIITNDIALLDGLENNFRDVDEEEWYATYVLTAQNAGIVKGISDSEFGIGRYITRQDAAVMFVRVLGITAQVEEYLVFDDNGNIAEYALDAVYVMRESGLINGYEANLFKPSDYLSRAEIAAIISRYLSSKE